MRTIIGIDPSFAGLALVAIPSDWGCRLDRVKRVILADTNSRDPLPGRIARLAIDVERWIAWARGNGPLSIWIEGSITSGQNPNTIRMQIELAACIKHEIWREQGFDVQTAEQSSARKLFLGKLPASERKDAVVAHFDRLWPEAGWEHDLVDAVVTANYGLSVLGFEHIATPAPPKAKRSTRKGQVAFA